jgi:hypothetical protein
MASLARVATSARMRRAAGLVVAAVAAGAEAVAAGGVGVPDREHPARTQAPTSNAARAAQTRPGTAMANIHEKLRDASTPPSPRKPVARSGDAVTRARRGRAQVALATSTAIAGP